MRARKHLRAGLSASGRYGRNRTKPPASATAPEHTTAQQHLRGMLLGRIVAGMSAPTQLCGRKPVGAPGLNTFTISETRHGFLNTSPPHTGRGWTCEKAVT